ncbi:MAG TPA: heavy metal-binding domain-containing protein [Bacteroidales bacterium]|nr:heavy metal-binding domain-containing protein [Bacteroidales bacterium]
MAKLCSKCGATGGFLQGLKFTTINHFEYCPDCAQKYFDNVMRTIRLTTTNNIDGYLVKNYVDIASVEVVIGTGVFTEFGGDISDFFGARSTGFEVKLQKAKEAALARLKFIAFEKAGDGAAVVGVDLDYTEFSGNRIGVIANGTIVELQEIGK